MRTPAFALAVLTAISPLALAAPVSAPGNAIANGTPIVTGGTLAPASAVHVRDDPQVVRRPVIGTVVSGFPKCVVYSTWLYEADIASGLHRHNSSVQGP